MKVFGHDHTKLMNPIMKKCNVQGKKREEHYKILETKNEKFFGTTAAGASS
jgi:hypothetical protein